MTSAIRFRDWWGKNKTKVKLGLKVCRQQVLVQQWQVGEGVQAESRAGRLEAECLHRGTGAPMLATRGQLALLAYY